MGTELMGANVYFLVPTATATSCRTHCGFTLNRHGDVIKVTVVGLIPGFKVPLRNTSQAIFICGEESAYILFIYYGKISAIKSINLVFDFSEKDPLRLKQLAS